MSNGFTQNEQPIPDINTDVNLIVSNDTVCRTDVQRVAEHWNQLAAYGIKPVNRIIPGAKRFDMIRARIRTYGVEKVFEAVENIKKSSFLCGHNKNGWAITFDWFVRPNNFIKVLEGNYDDARTNATPADTGQQCTSKSGYPLELLKKLSEGGVSGYGQFDHYLLEHAKPAWAGAAKTHYNCQECQDTGWITFSQDGYEVMGRCSCYAVKRAKELMEKSGLSRESSRKALTVLTPGKNQCLPMPKVKQ